MPELETSLQDSSSPLCSQSKLIYLYLVDLGVYSPAFWQASLDRTATSPSTIDDPGVHKLRNKHICEPSYFIVSHNKYGE